MEGKRLPGSEVNGRSDSRLEQLVSTYNPNPLAPVPVLPERVSTVLESKIADGPRARYGSDLERSRVDGFQHQEQLVERDPSIARGFLSGVGHGYQSSNGNVNHPLPVEAQIAPGRSRLADGSPSYQPTWAAVDGRELDGFARGANHYDGEGQREYQSILAFNPRTRPNFATINGD